MSNGSRERRQKKRYGAPRKDTLFNWSPNHARPCSFSFDWKSGEKEAFFKKYGGPIKLAKRDADNNTGPNRPEPSDS